MYALVSVQSINNKKYFCYVADIKIEQNFEMQNILE